ncbi:hypothetical protein HPB52_009128 [Rhipicephalus sanguineus]|uniref:Uncharacterized protein n=1 Tax=Rhipicephalus sanguineus TaxID=34632 RepID=A0A9D4T5B1_RHISA|nr:hypothetical protein HPB52_009128 [Rhipicephalus sanguineus]
MTKLPPLLEKNPNVEHAHYADDVTIWQMRWRRERQAFGSALCDARHPSDASVTAKAITEVPRKRWNAMSGEGADDDVRPSKPVSQITATTTFINTRRKTVEDVIIKKRIEAAPPGR